MSSLRSLVLTPQRTPSFVIVTRSPLLFLSPQLHRRSPDRTRLLSDPDDSPVPDPPEALLSPAASPRFLLHRPRIRPPHRADTTSDAAESADTDLTTRAAMSLPHVRKVITPYGFRAVLAASPCTRRRESLFHRNKPVTVTVTDTDQQDPWADQQDPWADPPTPPNPGPDRSPVCLRPIRAFGLQVMKELRRPAAALKALSPATRTRPR